MTPAERHVVVLGASPKAHRYSNQAVRLLLAQGFPVTPIHPRIKSIEGLPVLDSLERVPAPVDTLTLYLAPQRLEPLTESILALTPQRVIFNPGSESPALERQLDRAGIPWLHACTLIMLGAGRF